MKKGILVVIIIFLVFSAAIAYKNIIHVPAIKGKVIDAESGNPIRGVNVRVRWITGYADLGGGHGGTFKVYATKTDESGEFFLPEVKKLKIPIVEVYRGEQILIYEHGYVHQTIGRDAQQEKQIKYYQIALKKIKDDEEYNKHLEKIRNLLISDTYKYYDPKFVIDDCKMFLEKFSYSRFFEENYRLLAIIYKETGDYKSALKVNEEFVVKFPKSPIIERVNEDIQILKGLVQDSSKTRGQRQ